MNTFSNFKIQTEVSKLYVDLLCYCLDCKVGQCCPIVANKVLFGNFAYFWNHQLCVFPDQI